VLGVSMKHKRTYLLTLELILGQRSKRHFWLPTVSQSQISVLYR
jgi:hypothetical protein